MFFIYILVDFIYVICIINTISEFFDWDNKTLYFKMSPFYASYQLALFRSQQTNLTAPKEQLTFSKFLLA